MVLPGGVPVGQVLPLQRQADRLRLARLQLDPLEAAQLLDGPGQGGVQVLDIHLDHLVAGPLPRVPYVHANRDLAGRADGIRGSESGWGTSGNEGSLRN